MNVGLQPTETDGQFWVRVSMDGEVRRHGPFADADEAEDHGDTAGRVVPR